MVQAHGVLENGRVVIHDPSEASRLADKGAYGSREKGALVLDLLEASYLVEEGRLAVADAAAAAVGIHRLVGLGADTVPGFETTYLAYRDHRARGFVVRLRQAATLDVWERGAAPPRQRPSTLVAARAEADTASPASLAALVDEAERHDRALLLSVVDEESDVTHYDLAPAVISGGLPDVARDVAPRCAAVLLHDRALVVEDGGLAAGGYGNTAGGQRFLSLAETHHLAVHGLRLTGLDGRAAPREDVLARARALHPDAAHALAAYAWLRERDLVPKTGFKFGVQYRVYRGLPGQAHAPFLVHALAPDAPWTLQDLARFVRLTHSVKKKAVLWSDDRGLLVQWTRP